MCGALDSNTLEHHCLHCPEVEGMLPRGVPLVEVCRHLLKGDTLDVILARFPKFGGC
ncbi:hypothetical protein E2C01_093799 [Portunus trituberculatus]|uniref:Uncharacterized protein n=1 Tax=Portunus trituberculatus TaxID=210409 RepID=A0A5B7JZP8_PORTR|nr:hypothetical protein [Portunus trituberculatus]